MKRIALLFITLLLWASAKAQSPVNSVGSGCSLDFDGTNDYIRCSASNLGITNTITVSAWVKTTTSDYKWIVGKYTFSDDAGWHLVMFNGGYFAMAGRDGSGNYRSVTSLSNGFNDGKWHYVTGIIANNIWMIYVDGILQNTLNTNYFSTDLATTVPLEIGRYWYTGQYWDNQIDEVRIWNYARTEAEIRRDMCRRLTGTEPGLVGYWRFDECGGNVALDSSPNGNHGTLY